LGIGPTRRLVGGRVLRFMKGSCDLRFTIYDFRFTILHFGKEFSSKLITDC
jgi:hypothetical protein